MGPSMGEGEQVSHLIGDIYDAALDPALWPSVQQRACEVVRASASTLYWQDSTRKIGSSFTHIGIEPDFTESYFEKFIKINPLNTAVLFFGVEDVRSIADVMPHAEYRQTRFYEEWMRPQGFLDGAFCILEKSATSGTLFTLIRKESDGLIDDEMLRRMRLIIPHVRRAALIGKVIDLHRAEAAALADTVGGLGVATLLVDGNSRITYANAAAHGMLAEASVIRETAGKLTALDPEADRALRDIFTIADRGDVAVGTKGIAIPMAAHGERYVAHVLPLTSGARRKAGSVYSAVVAVFVRKAELNLTHPLEALVNAYKLTPAEVRVLMMIVETGNVAEVASILGISETTVKTHLQHIFEKTGTRRQAELVKLVAGYMSPLGQGTQSRPNA